MKTIKMWTGNGFATVNEKHAEDVAKERGWFFELPTDDQINALILNPMQEGWYFDPIQGKVLDQDGEVKMII